MKQIKQYQMPVMTDQDPVVNQMSATPNVDGWDGNQDDGNDQKEEDLCWRQEECC